MDWIELLGGIAIFIYGLQLANDGLQKWAGDHLRRWGAKHSWHEGEGAQRARVYEFDEPLPARDIRLLVRSR